MGKRPSRCVIVTGDDFGISSEVNHAIIEAHERGILTSASLMVTGEAFEEAVELARQHPTLAVGLHLVLVDGRSVLAPTRIPDLVDPRGFFPDNPVAAGWRCQVYPSGRRQTRQEIRAQLEKFQKTGLPLSHVDGHQHLHVAPVVLAALRNLSREFGIRAVRLPNEELHLGFRLDGSRHMEKLKFSAAFSAVRICYANRLLKGSGIRSADRVYGLLQTGRMTEDYLLRLVPRIRVGCAEIYSHPTLDPDVKRSHGASRFQLDALLSGRVREAIAAAGFRLGTYRDLN